MAVINPDKIADILRETAALHIMPRFQALKDHEIASKTNPNDLVTQADLDAEAHLKRVLPALLPGSVVIGEEGISKGEDSLEILKDASQKTWVVDPVDGTRNFVHGKPEFGVMLACVVGGETVAGWIYDPLKDTVYAAEKGSGAYQNGDVRLKVRKGEDPAAMSAHINYGYFPKDIRDELKAFVSTAFAQNMAVGSSAHEYTRVARGLADASFYARSRIWDNLPGTLIVQEAGGHVAQFNGQPLTPANDRAHVIVATSIENWRFIQNEFLTKTGLKNYI